jgi:hypothetical protein
MTLALFVALTWGSRELSRTRAAQRELDALRAEVIARARATGSLPTNLSELGWRLPPIFGNKGPVDPWGTPYRYRALGSNRFELGTGRGVTVSEIAGFSPTAAQP